MSSEELQKTPTWRLQKLAEKYPRILATREDPGYRESPWSDQFWCGQQKNDEDWLMLVSVDWVQKLSFDSTAGNHCRCRLWKRIEIIPSCKLEKWLFRKAIDQCTGAIGSIDSDWKDTKSFGKLKNKQGNQEPWRCSDTTINDGRLLPTWLRMGFLM